MDNLWWYGLYRRRTSIDMTVLNYQFRGDQATKTTNTHTHTHQKQQLNF